jgi:hypothetical protein
MSDARKDGHFPQHVQEAITSVLTKLLPSNVEPMLSAPYLRRTRGRPRVGAHLTGGKSRYLELKEQRLAALAAQEALPASSTAVQQKQQQQPPPRPTPPPPSTPQQQSQQSSSVGNANAAAWAVATSVVDGVPVRRGRGRPRKYPLPGTVATVAVVVPPEPVAVLVVESSVPVPLVPTVAVPIDVDLPVLPDSGSPMRDEIVDHDDHHDNDNLVHDSVSLSDTELSDGDDDDDDDTSDSTSVSPPPATTIALSFRPRRAMQPFVVSMWRAIASCWLNSPAHKVVSTFVRCEQRRYRSRRRHRHRQRARKTRVCPIRSRATNTIARRRVAARALARRRCAAMRRVRAFARAAWRASISRLAPRLRAKRRRAPAWSGSAHNFGAGRGRGAREGQCDSCTVARRVRDAAARRRAARLCDVGAGRRRQARNRRLLFSARLSAGSDRCRNADGGPPVVEVVTRRPTATTATSAAMHEPAGGGRGAIRKRRAAQASALGGVDVGTGLRRLG